MASTEERSTIGLRFDTQANALNFLRLCLALEVVGWHSYALRGATWLPGWAERFLSDIAVDSFFAISGFLICRSWLRSRSLRTYLSARALRIFPGLWGCLLVTAFVIAPTAALVSGTMPPGLSEQLGYVVGNAGAWVTRYDIADGPLAVPFVGVWNGSLWSLGFEVMWYAGLGLLGLCRLLRRRIVGAIVVLLWLTNTLAMFVGVPLAGMNGLLALALRTGLMFFCGTLMYLNSEHVRASRAVALGTAITLAIGIATPDYRVIAAPGIAYLCIYGGLALGRHPRLRIDQDLSYGTYVYAFPIQQALLLCGVRLSWGAFAAVSTLAVLPLAALSWSLIERPGLRLRVGSRRTSGSSPEPSAAGTTVLSAPQRA